MNLMEKKFVVIMDGVLEKEVVDVSGDMRGIIVKIRNNTNVQKKMFHAVEMVYVIQKMDVNVKMLQG